ncbi:MAG: hypothetical protein HETSPECPRED_007504 [Heterodermia speciosa]|uniref:Sulfhydryl oxidase n=1 Tax=Heterodermia speciosa TaxID=116794 RepID=A0A8H3FSG5_9LECA|nr:MAG: hypothetical protein HETSPECPRED_007504 [Heterodermia speciosa]
MDKFFAAQAKKKPQEQDAPISEQPPTAPPAPSKHPKGVVLDKDGKPCRTCTSSANWAAMMKATSASTSPTPLSAALTSSSSSNPLPTDCPPDVDTLGTHTWTLLHSISATYPSRASAQQQNDMRSFLSLFSRIYPCWVCADDFQTWMKKAGNEPRVEGREGLGRWMCEAHNEVNRKLGKEEFDCGRWEERWRTGWKDGRCG